MNLQLISFNDFEKKRFGFYIMHHGKDDWGNFAALKVIKMIFALHFFFRGDVSIIQNNTFNKRLLTYQYFHINEFDTTSVIRQKGQFQNRCFKKTKHIKFSVKQTFFTP